MTRLITFREDLRSGYKILLSSVFTSSLCDKFSKNIDPAVLHDVISSFFHVFAPVPLPPQLDTVTFLFCFWNIDFFFFTSHQYSSQLSAFFFLVSVSIFNSIHCFSIWCQFTAEVREQKSNKKTSSIL